MANQYIKWNINNADISNDGKYTFTITASATIPVSYTTFYVSYPTIEQQYKDHRSAYIEKLLDTQGYLSGTDHTQSDIEFIEASLLKAEVHTLECLNELFPDHPKLKAIGNFI